MPDHRKHRGAHPKDKENFQLGYFPKLRLAAADLCLFLTKGYPENAALKLVGDHFRLNKRQRLAIRRGACSRDERDRRLSNAKSREHLVGSEIYIDGFNLLITIESALSGAFLFKGYDGQIRDMASIHGTYKRVQETAEAILLIGHTLNTLKVRHVHWFLDSPISNSGRLKRMISDIAEENDWNWSIDLVNDPDKVLKESDKIVITSDSEILNHSHHFDLVNYLLANEIEKVLLLNLFPE